MARWIAALAVAAGLAAPGSALAAETTKLETNAAATPLGIDDAKPKLSWRLEGSERGLTTDQLPDRRRHHRRARGGR